MELYRKGAEANLYLGDGRLVKERVEKKYRLPMLDRRLRRQRTRREAKNMERALKAGVRTPKVLRVDEKKYALEMEFLGGELVKDVFERGEKIDEISFEVGSMLRRLHDSKFVHNDLTTSNLILGEDGVYMIDFGLAYHTTRLEDKAMDLVVFKKSIMATHTSLMDEIWENLLKGYKPDNETLKRVETIENRVRYK
ncbi:MAG: Kae1-associated serine/threonine protein kinase [Candidatus Altiarchaeales archaeon]|nr:Kae1-associated serine/threonine protein kinase [Candidatus Altiarchaeales archaeon]MBD3415853.1 Kae1-associated serine/threonine protein kinase [Candidatus Altiarchaeales archaeon]